jgi:hypothetical protein
MIECQVNFVLAASHINVHNIYLFKKKKEKKKEILIKLLKKKRKSTPKTKFNSVYMMNLYIYLSILSREKILSRVVYYYIFICQLIYLFSNYIVYMLYFMFMCCQCKLKSI